MENSDIIKNGLESKQDGIDKKFMIREVGGLDFPLFIELSFNNKNNSLTVEMYESYMYSLSDKSQGFIDNPFNKEYILNAALRDDVKTDDDGNRLMVCSADAMLTKDGVFLLDCRTLEKYQRRGLASFAIQLIEDYFMTAPQAKEALEKMNVSEIYASKCQADSDMKYKTTFEANRGAFGELLSNIKAKMSKGRNSQSAAERFLKDNALVSKRKDFGVEVLHREIEKRGIINSKLFGENPYVIQVGGRVFEYDPKMLEGEYCGHIDYDTKTLLEIDRELNG